MSAQDWAIICSSVIGALGIRQGIPALIKWLTGATKRRRAEVDRMAAERNLERTRVRILRESLSWHRRLMYEAPCIDPENIPPYPDLPTKE